MVHLFGSRPSQRPRLTYSIDPLVAAAATAAAAQQPVLVESGEWHFQAVLRSRQQRGHELPVPSCACRSRDTEISDQLEPVHSAQIVNAKAHT